MKAGMGFIGFFYVQETIRGSEEAVKMNDNKRTKAILIVSFGTSHLDALKKNIEAVEIRIREAHPDYAIYRAFTSGMIIRKLKKEYDIFVPTVKDALAAIHAEGFRELVVQPTHIINGVENDQMLEDIACYQDRFERIDIGSPLLTDTSDYMELAQIMAKEIKLPPGTALVLMGHGTSHDANAVYPALDYVFKDMGYSDIFIASVEAYPELDRVIIKLHESGYQKVILRPLMLVAGVHARIDMAGETDSWKSRLQEEGFAVECMIKGLGELQPVQEMFLRHMNIAMKGMMVHE